VPELPLNVAPTSSRDSQGNAVFVTESARPIRMHPLTPTFVPRQDRAVIDRLAQHRLVLESAGIGSLAALGPMQLGGTVAPDPGVIVPRPQQVTGTTIFQNAMRLRAGVVREFEAFSGTASVLGGRPIPPALFAAVPPPPGPGQPVDFADAITWQGSALVGASYLAASSITIADDTTVVLKYPVRWLVIITPKLIVGDRVTFTWERPIMPPAAGGSNGGAGEEAPMSGDLVGNTGGAGGAGTSGGPGARGQDGMELELWTLELDGAPAFDLRGQNGGAGGRGGDGGPGGRGSKGRTALVEWHFWVPVCKSGPGDGGNGGNGGAAGPGGRGGEGGTGGVLRFYAPQPVLTQYTQAFYATVDGGAGGPGGPAGLPGPGGPGGQPGDNPHNCARGPRDGEPAGSPGASGAGAATGAAGAAGVAQGRALRFVAITKADFDLELVKPRITQVDPLYAVMGDQVTMTGLRFDATDELLLDGVRTSSTFISDTTRRFAVPLASGGRRAIEIRRADGTLSNKGTLYVRPEITATDPAGRLRPGRPATVRGSGFAPGARVRLRFATADGTWVERDIDEATVVNPGELTFTVRRPPDVPEANPDGEPVELLVVLADNTPSNRLAVELDTFRMLVIGDSVLWGQGLQEQEKLHRLLRSRIKANVGGIGTYVEMRAHSGAVIGFRDDDTPDPTDEDSLCGEAPTSYPTVLQQCVDPLARPDTVDLVLVNGGINDVNARNILNPLAGTNEALKTRIDRYCRRHMQLLLEAAGQTYPNAQIVATGYYPMLSKESDLAFIDLFLVGLGVAGINPLGPVGALLAIPLGLDLKNKVVARSLLFDRESKRALKRAVDNANTTLGGDRVVRVLPGFRPENAVFAPESWLWGLNGDLTPRDVAIAPARERCCRDAGARVDYGICTRASVGHPNPRGAQAYADAIAATVLGTPLRPFTETYEPGSARTVRKDGNWLRDPQGRYLLFRGVNLSGRSKRPPYLPLLPLDVKALDAAGIARFKSELQARRSDLDTIRSLGMNIVRLPVMWKALEPRPNPDPAQLLPEGVAYLDLLRLLVDALYLCGIYVLIDFHQDIAHEVYGGDGLPDWALAIDADHPRPKASNLKDTKWGLHYYETLLTANDVLVRHTLRSLWRNSLRNEEIPRAVRLAAKTEAVRTHLEKTIGATARYFQALNGGQGHPGILGYELINEPHPVGLGKAAFESTHLPEFYANAVTEMAADRPGAPGDKTSLIFVEPRMDWTTFSASGPEFQNLAFTQKPSTFLDTSRLPANRLALAYHYYDPWTLTYGGLHKPDDMGRKALEWPDVFDRLKQAAVDRGAVPFLTEFGASNDWDAHQTDFAGGFYGTQTRAYIDLQFRQVERTLVSAVYWQYDLYATDNEKDNWNLENFSLLGPDRRVRNRDLITRPYPMRSSALPAHVWFDPESRHAAFIFEGPVAQASTILFVPKAVHYTARARAGDPLKLPFEVRATSPDVGWDASRQVLLWRPASDRQVNQIIICPRGEFDPSKLPEASRDLLASTTHSSVAR
jgi:aryl-phospho-beta-D-glucosidase BglC (GH1 family)/lysophospholipase L1-like esterase